jgi:UPF0716 protein FxsA
MGWHWWILITAVLDLIFLSRFGRQIGGGNLFLWLGAAAVLGILAIRTGGFPLRPERRPAGLVSRGLVFLAGILLIFPGPLSDVLGLLLLCRPIRDRVAGRVRERAARWFQGGRGGFTFVKTGRRGGPAVPFPPGSPEGPPAPSEGARSGPEGAPAKGAAGASPAPGGRAEEGSFPGAAGARDVDFSIEPGRKGDR